MACILPLFPRLEQALARQPPKVRERCDSKGFHRWEPFDLPCSWRCSICWLVKFESDGHPSAYGCKALPAVIARCCAAPKCHRHALFDSVRGPFVACVRCGAYAWRRSPLLRQTCKGKPVHGSFGERVLRRLASGCLPPGFQGSSNQLCLGAVPADASARVSDCLFAGRLAAVLARVRARQ